MAEIPDDVEKWNLGHIVNLIHEGYDESQILEFKRELSEDPNKISHTACAFANTAGGFLIFGVNNDRTTKLTLDQRLVGLQDSDDLKSKITNHIKHIKPDLLANNTIFKQSNIKLENNRVIVIAKILKSEEKPHQIDHKCYKRTPNGNAPMEVEEIRQLVLESQKSKRLLVLLEQEGGFLKRRLDVIISRSKDGTLSDLAYEIDGLLIADAFEYFLHNQAHLYNIAVHNALAKFLLELEKLRVFRNNYREYLETKQKDETWLKNAIKRCTKRSISYLDEIGKVLNLDYKDPVPSEDPDKIQTRS